MGRLTFGDITAAVARAAADAPAAPASLAGWRAGFRVGSDTFSSALEGGLRAGQLAFCFAAGYQAALRRLVPLLPADAFAALLVTEGKKQRPEDLQTVLTPQPGGGFRLDGEKSWVAGGQAADVLLVLARTGVLADGRTGAALVMLPAGHEGVALEEKPATGFLDAVPHARGRFTAVVVMPDMLLPGDGWRDHARPFRTHEDIHVSTAVAAHLAVHAVRARWPDAVLASLLAALDRLAECAAGDARDPRIHLLLAGAEQELAQVAARMPAPPDDHDDAFARDWRSNGMLMTLAVPARIRRLEKARLSIFPDTSRS